MYFGLLSLISIKLLSKLKNNEIKEVMIQTRITSRGKSTFLKMLLVMISKNAHVLSVLNEFKCIDDITKEKNDNGVRPQLNRFSYLHYVKVALTKAIICTFVS